LTRSNVILILLLLTAFGLRLYRLDHQEIWGDEAHSAYVVKLPLSSTISPRTETNPPLYHLLLYLWVRLTGCSVFALRFLSLVLGVLTVPLIYQLARLAFGQLVGLLAALLGAISPFLVYYSQEARMYALATFATTLSMLLLMKIVASQEGQSRLRRFAGNLRSLDILWLAYLLATAAAIFTHYYALFVVVAQNALVIALWRRNRGFDTPWFRYALVSIRLGFDTPSATQPKRLLNPSGYSTQGGVDALASSPGRSGFVVLTVGAGSKGISQRQGQRAV